MSGFTTVQLQVLEQAIASGTRTVSYQDRTVTYQSLEEMLKLRQVMRDELGLSGGASGDRFSRASFSRE